MDYRDFRQPSRPAPTQLDPDPNKAPALVVFVNFPPDPKDPKLVHKDILALYCPVFTMFEVESQYEFKRTIIEDFPTFDGNTYWDSTKHRFATYPTKLTFAAYKESILGWFPNTPRPGKSSAAPYSLQQVGLQDLILNVREFIRYSQEFGIANPPRYPTQFIYGDEGVSKGLGKSKSECFLNALDSLDHCVYKAATFEELRKEGASEEKEVVKGLIKEMWRIIDISSGEGRITRKAKRAGGVLRVSVEINFKSKQSAISTNGLEPPADLSLEPPDYVAEVSKQFIASAGRINTLLNLMEDFRVGPEGPQVIPKNLKIEIGGHTDRVGPEIGPGGNEALSLKRATAVLEFLKKKSKEILEFTGRDDTQDFISARLMPMGYGSSECDSAVGVDNPKARKVTFRIAAST